MLVLNSIFFFELLGSWKRNRRLGVRQQLQNSRNVSLDHTRLSISIKQDPAMKEPLSGILIEDI